LAQRNPQNFGVASQGPIEMSSVILEEGSDEIDEDLNIQDREDGPNSDHSSDVRLNLSNLNLKKDRRKLGSSDGGGSQKESRKEQLEIETDILKNQKDEIAAKTSALMA
jgi:hypothetical protein